MYMKYRDLGIKDVENIAFCSNKIDLPSSNNRHVPCAAMGWPPKLADESFLPTVSNGKIKEMYKAEKDRRDGQKMLVAYHYKSGMSIRGRRSRPHEPRDRAALDSGHAQEGRGGTPAPQGAGRR